MKPILTVWAHAAEAANAARMKVLALKNLIVPPPRVGEILTDDPYAAETIRQLHVLPRNGEARSLATGQERGGLTALERVAGERRRRRCLAEVRGEGLARADQDFAASEGQLDEGAFAARQHAGVERPARGDLGRIVGDHERCVEA